MGKLDSGEPRSEETWSRFWGDLDIMGEIGVREENTRGPDQSGHSDRPLFSDPSLADVPLLMATAFIGTNASIYNLHIMPVKAIVFGILLSATAANLVAQSPSDEQSIRQRFADLDKAWNHHDAQQITNPHTAVADADFITVVGSWIRGREAFVATMTKLQAGPFHDVERHTVVEKIRFVRPDVAVVITTNVDRHGEGQPSESRGTYVLSKEEGHWLLDSFQNTQVSTPPGPPPASPSSNSAPR